MKKNVNPRSVLVALSIVLTMGLGTAVFAEPDEGQAEIQVLEQGQTEQVIMNGAPEPEELVMDFMMNKAEEELGEPAQKKSTRKNKLDPNGAIIYDYLFKEIGKIAEGKRESTEINMPVSELLGEKLSYDAKDLGVEWAVRQNESNPAAEEALYDLIAFDGEKLFKALLADAPYKLYWLDKTVGLGIVRPSIAYYPYTDRLFFFEDATIDFKFTVSQDYKPDQATDRYTVDKNKTGDTLSAAQKAASVVEEAGGKTDYQRLVSYRDYICKEVDYNESAADKNNSTLYGDPWQLIWVFDGDPDTDVVCEGYSKAFKFLCDLTNESESGGFSGEVDCHTVSGSMRGGTGEGKHMWNLVRLGGENYLVDVTNCDDGTVGAPGELFLRGSTYEENTYNSYLIEAYDEWIGYAYDSGTISIFDRNELELSASDRYVENSEPGNDNEDPELPHRHSFGDWIVTIEPDYDSEGEQTRTCDCGETERRPIKALIRTPITKATITGISNRIYTGKAQTQMPTVKLGTVTLTNGEDYEITYNNNTNVGKATITITGINGYEGKIDKTFSINPRGTSIRSLKKGKKSFTVKWTKQAAQTSGYQVQYGLKSSFKGAKTVTVSGAGKVSKKVTKLKKKKNYYVRVRTFTTVSGTKYCSAWSKAKKVKTK